MDGDRTAVAETAAKSQRRATAGAEPGRVDRGSSSCCGRGSSATQRLAEDLYFREKAFWTFSRGQRLGDLRRQIRKYGRTQDQVFPVGDHYRGGKYGTDVNLPVPQAEENNPVLESRPACIDRNA